MVALYVQEATETLITDNIQGIGQALKTSTWAERPNPRISVYVASTKEKGKKKSFFPGG
jgi:hypothetical protein